MYIKAKSCINMKDSCMPHFVECSQGVRQGTILSPLLFPIFLNNIKDFVKQSINCLTMIFYTMSDKGQTYDVSIFPKVIYISVC